MTSCPRTLTLHYGRAVRRGVLAGHGRRKPRKGKRNVQLRKGRHEGGWTIKGKWARKEINNQEKETSGQAEYKSEICKALGQNNLVRGKSRQ